MSDDRRIQDFREWSLAVLSLLCASAARQSAWLHRMEVGADELLLQFDCSGGTQAEATTAQAPIGGS